MRLGINGRFYGAGITGVQRFARELTTRLVPLVDVVILLPNGTHASETDACETHRGRLGGHAWEQVELPAMAKRAGCDITLHLSGTAPVHGGPHAIVVHDVLPLTHPHFFSKRFARLYRSVLARAVPRAATVITVSESSRQAIVDTLGAHRNLRVVTQGLAPFEAPAPRAEVERVRASFGLTSSYLLAGGRGDPRKNSSFLDDVMTALQHRHCGSRLVVTGAATARVHGVRPDSTTGDTLFTGHVPDAELSALYTGATAFLFPSLAEGFGRPPIESMASGTPALVADVVGVPAELRALACALPLDAGIWADTIERLTGDAAQRQAMLRRSEAMRATLSWDTCATQVIDACMAGIAGTGAGPAPIGRPTQAARA